MPELEQRPSVDETRRQHDVAVCPPPGEYAGNEDRWELDCVVCGYVGAADTQEAAWGLARRHRSLR